MSELVGMLVLSGGERVVITFSDGTKEHGVYVETYGYTNVFKLDNGRETKLSNRFMKLKDIRVELEKPE